MIRGSIARRLTVGLGIVGAVGTGLLFLLVALEYGLGWETLSDGAALRLTLDELSEHVLVPVIVLILPMTVAARWVIRRALAPLARAARRIDAAQDVAPGFRIDAAEFPVEALPFAEAVNALLDRLERAAAGQRAFAADVAHELRTPLTVLALEVDQLDSAVGASAVGARLKADIAHMRRLIEQLMLLARVDADVAGLAPPAEVPLAEVAADVASLLAPVAIARDRTIALETDGNPRVVGRRDAVAAAVRNLVENALRVTPAGGTVTIAVGPGPELAVCDQGQGLSVDQLDSLRLRHRRGDHASSGGAGLGLAITDRIMAAHGGRLETDPAARALRLRFAPRRQRDVSFGA